MNLWFMLVGIGVVDLFVKNGSVFLVCGIVAVSVGILGMLVFGCGIITAIKLSSLLKTLGKVRKTA